MSEVLTAALEYARRGWHIFPCKPLGKQPATRNGFKDATADAELIRRWWAAMPSANIGLRTGVASGVFVIDIDVKGGAAGYDNWLALCKMHGWRSVPNVLAAGTPSGGAHFYFTYAASITNARGSLPAGVDVRGEGGYVLLPPSDVDAPATRIINGARLPYTWLYPDATDIMSAPAWLLEVLTPTSAPAPAATPATTPSRAAKVTKPMPDGIAGILAKVAAQGEGSRNNVLFWGANRLHEKGIPQTDAEVMLTPIAQAIGLAQAETVHTIASAYGGGR
jgi:uncharacterized protein YndB with AHSA1/START domain